MYVLTSNSNGVAGLYKQHLNSWERILDRRLTKSKDYLWVPQCTAPVRELKFQNGPPIDLSILPDRTIELLNNATNIANKHHDPIPLLKEERYTVTQILPLPKQTTNLILFIQRPTPHIEPLDYIIQQHLKLY